MVFPTRSFTLTFVDVLEDSRCPLDLVCVWEGMFPVAIRISSAGQDYGIFE